MHYDIVYSENRYFYMQKKHVIISSIISLFKIEFQCSSQSLLDFILPNDRDSSLQEPDPLGWINSIRPINHPVHSRQ